jgi:hypothetical protein
MNKWIQNSFPHRPDPLIVLIQPVTAWPAPASHWPIGQQPSLFPTIPRRALPVSVCAQPESHRRRVPTAAVAPLPLAARPGTYHARLLAWATQSRALPDCVRLARCHGCTVGQLPWQPRPPRSDNSNVTTCTAPTSPTSQMSARARPTPYYGFANHLH